MTGWRARLGLGVALAVGAATAGCAARPRMCEPGACHTGASCVAGRCQRDDGVPAVAAASRMVLAPTVIGYVRHHESPSLVPRGEGAVPPVVTLGRAGDGETRLYAKFAVPLPENMQVVEAYLLLERAAPTDPLEGAVTLRAARVVEPWDPRSLSFGRQPRAEDGQSAEVRVAAGGGRWVRLDVRALVARWRRHDPADQGVVLSASGATSTGISIAVAPIAPSDGAQAATRPLVAAEPLRPVGVDDLRPPDGAEGSPRLELYVRWADR